MTHIAEEDGWDVHNYCEDFTEVQLEFEKYSSAGQDFNFSISTKSGSTSDFLDEMESYIDGYDPDEEAVLWIGPDGHGINGAPYRITDIVEDMEECKQNMQALYSNLYKSLYYGI